VGSICHHNHHNIGPYVVIAGKGVPSEIETILSFLKLTTNYAKNKHLWRELFFVKILVFFLFFSLSLSFHSTAECYCWYWWVNLLPGMKALCLLFDFQNSKHILVEGFLLCQNFKLEMDEGWILFLIEVVSVVFLATL